MPFGPEFNGFISDMFPLRVIFKFLACGHLPKFGKFQRNSTVLSPIQGLRNYTLFYEKMPHHIMKFPWQSFSLLKTGVFYETLMSETVAFEH